MNNIKIRKALSPAYRKHKPLRQEVNAFIEQLQRCLDIIAYSDQQNESEEHIKEPIKNFLRNTFYQDHLINTKERVDLAIYLGKTAKSDVGVLLETKKPSNRAEFPTQTNLNKKALHELLLYYLRERVDGKNNNIKHLIATNGYEWFLFKGEDFYKHFYKNRALIKEYEEFRDGLKDSSKNELFYNEIARKYLTEVEEELPFVHIDLSKVKLQSLSDTKLNALYKIFSNVHLLGHSFGNDSNQLNKSFYHELLHIIGLEEVKEKGKKLITRLSEKDRDYASILENTLYTLEDRDYLSRAQAFENDSEKGFKVALQLSLTWINRILFLKLLESQLLAYHKNDQSYKFLNANFIQGYDGLNDLFFSALARRPEERHPRFRDKYRNIPYLNSSLFERNQLERETFELTALRDDEMQVYPKTVLKDHHGKRLSGKLDTLTYLFRFLDAYDFAATGEEGIAEGKEQKSLINASVLGLIFEKINGYKEGSFYTPGYITMYMARETLRKAVIQKFNESEHLELEDFDDLKFFCRSNTKKENALRYNGLINSLKVCDPAVGSGHFLVSSLNELIVIKNELGLLLDQDGFPLQCEIEVDNDELHILTNQGNLFEYHPDDRESHKIQQALFHEKQTLIEQCLFGVDINPNSVKICRLRLWIELLKNAYYTEEKQLQTLPNIDINIKRGNSLISRFGLKDDLKSAFKTREVEYSFTDYKNAVAEYKNTNSKAQKVRLLEIIHEVKNNFKSTLDNKFIDKFQKERGAYVNEKERQNNLAAFGERISKKEKDQLKELKKKSEAAYLEKQEIVDNAIYRDAFEWRFEFPEVLDDEGNYLGFDVVIGNPPYIRQEALREFKPYFKKNFKLYTGTADIYIFFIEKGFEVLKSSGLFTYIMPNKFMQAGYGKPARSFFLDRNLQEIIDFGDLQVFEGATTYPCILTAAKEDPNTHFDSVAVESLESQDNFKEYVNTLRLELEQEKLSSDAWMISNPQEQMLLEKLKQNGIKLENYIDAGSKRGVLTGFSEAFLIDEKTKKEIIETDPNSQEILRPLLRGRDVSPWFSNLSGYSLVATFPSLRIDIADFRGIEEHLLSYGKKRLEQSGEFGSRKKTSGKWFETQDSIAYWEEFERPKIMYQKFQVKPCFIYDDQNSYCNDSMWIIPTDDKVLLGILNSKLGWWLISKYCTAIQNGYQLIWKYFSQIPVARGTEGQRSRITKKVDEIILVKKENQNTDLSGLEDEINELVYGLYELTEEEKLIIERI